MASGCCSSDQCAHFAGLCASGRRLHQELRRQPAGVSSTLCHTSTNTGNGVLRSLFCTVVVCLVQVYFYSVTGVRVSKQVSFGPQLEAEGISQACLYPDGIVVLGANSTQLWAAVGLQEPRAVRLPAIPGLTNNSSSSAAVSCLAVLEPQFTLSNGLEVRMHSLLQPALLQAHACVITRAQQTPLPGLQDCTTQ